MSGREAIMALFSSEIKYGVAWDQMVSDSDATEEEESTPTPGADWEDSCDTFFFSSD